MPDFEVMPIGTRNAMKETAMLLRQYERHHTEQAQRMTNREQADAQLDRMRKAERNAIAAERLEVLLGVPDPRTVPHADASGD